MLQLINGIHEIKLYNAENHRRWEWEKQQVQLFHIGLEGRMVGQYQEAGAFVINQLKNIFLTFISAKAVIDGNMSLGMMMSVQYIIGQLNSPIQQFIGFVIAAQDAKISLDRIGEIYQEKDEQQLHINSDTQLPELRNIELKDVSFKYPGMGDTWVLDKINLKIPQGKITAIVGSSGSGKTTLLKLLLKYQSPQKGTVNVDSVDLNQIHPTAWRNAIGAVMQDGFIFGDTVAGNIVVDGGAIDKTKLRKATEIAQIREFIESLPLGYNTKIGAEGISVSMGQRQRLLIARAIYKNPDVILFDEATNSLDANNERKIVDGLNEFYKNKTVVVVAHRLSTVKNADNIVVLDKGKIIEQGTHDELTALKGSYYTLVKNQLELGN
jgi:ATP-binding cassette subfamily B protein